MPSTLDPSLPVLTEPFVEKPLVASIPAPGHSSLLDEPVKRGLTGLTHEYSTVERGRPAAVRAGRECIRQLKQMADWSKWKRVGVHEDDLAELGQAEEVQLGQH